MRRALCCLLLAAVVLVAGAGKPKHPRGDGDRLSDHAMATIYWTGSAGDGNWNTVTNWSGGALPTTGDSVYVSRHARSGMFLNLDRTGDDTGAGLNLALFEIEEGFAHDIGTSATYLQMAADAVMDRGSGNVFLKSDDGTSAIDTDLVTVKKPSGIGMFNLSDEGSAGTSNVAQLRVVSGHVRLSTYELPLVYVTPTPGADTFTTLETEYTVGSILSLYVAGGYVRLRTDVTPSATLYMSGGLLEFGIPEAPQTIVTLIQSGGLVRLASGSQYVQIANYTGLDGELDMNAETTYQSSMTLRVGPQFSYELGSHVTATIITFGD